MRRAWQKCSAKAADYGLVDRIAALCLLPIILGLLAIICPVLLVAQGRPIFYVGKRMKSRHATFGLIKLRTMRSCGIGGQTVLGGHATARVTPLGWWLRAFRVDEIPQIFNVLRGDMRFIGPRPPLRQYVDAYPALYARVFERPPGITGLATVRFHGQEARLLEACRSLEEADEVFRTKCLPAKARLDLFYQQHRSVWLDLQILYWTFSRLQIALPINHPRFTLHASRARGNLTAAS